MEESDYYRFKLTVGGWCIAKRNGDGWYLFGSQMVQGPVESEDLGIYGTIGENIKFPKK